MKIRIDKLNDELKKLKNLLDRYEENYLNFYSELKNCSINWKDVYAEVLFSNVNIEKKDTQIFYEELLSFRDIYEEIVTEYYKYGDKLFFSGDDDIFTKFNDYSNYLDNLINKYNYLDSFSDLQEYSYLKKERNKLIENRRNFIKIKDKYKKNYKNINESEEKIKRSINRYKISSINISDRKILSNNQKLYMETSKIDCSIKKLKYFVQEEDLILESLKLLFSSNYYESVNSSKLDEISMLLIKKYTTINKIHKENIKIIADSKISYEQAEKLLKNFKW